MAYGAFWAILVAAITAQLILVTAMIAEEAVLVMVVAVVVTVGVTLRKAVVSMLKLLVV